MTVALVGCGGDADSTTPEGVIDRLQDAGYAVDEVATLSAFEPRPQQALAVEGEGIPPGSVVAVEFSGTPRDAARLEKRYEAIDAAVVVRGAVVYSALPPVDAENLDAVLEATQP